MPRKTPNSQYNVAAPDSVPVRLATYQRKRMFVRFLQRFEPTQDDFILDVGATSDETYESSNYFEAWYPHKNRVTALGIDDASFLEQKFPGVRFINGNGTNLPFEERSMDFVHSSAVLEHVGNADSQRKMIEECARVSRKGFFITTPNRWFPVEFHTVIPLLHWLPKRWFRAILRSLGMNFFASEANLNLLTNAELTLLARNLPNFEVWVESVSLLFWPSNLLLIGRRKIEDQSKADSKSVT
ncbi:class I SAM-dependent methyltransferase [Paraburkholderia adhaesiva]|uniref:class I SAM-dependent methyltransferase n=1 Tax=Paraburkholderia adhaesiva TaxID=2883244 RepID=UPI001F2EB589|nr:class I SAM-dependent methyltransferase [Paraburkholderia adhaesiva]